MRLTIQNKSRSSVNLGATIGTVLFSKVLVKDLTVGQLEALQPTLVALENAGIISWTVEESPGQDNRAEGATLHSVDETGTRITGASTVSIDADTSIAALAFTYPAMFAPTAGRTIDLTDAPYSMRLMVYKTNTSGFGITLLAGNDWTTPYGLGVDYPLFGSDDYQVNQWELLIDAPNKHVQVRVGVQVGFEPEPLGPVTMGPGDTLDLFDTLIGVAVAGNQSTYQIGAPRSDGVAFMQNSVTATRRIQDLGLGDGPELLNEPPRANNILHSESLYVGAVLQSTWTAENGTTGLGGQAGSPRGDATAVNVIFPANPAAGVVCTSTGVGGDVFYCFHLWAKCLAGTELLRLEWEGTDSVKTTTADYTLTTTWQHLVLPIDDTGPFNAAAPVACKARILNGSDGAARTVQVWGIQGEIGLYPTSYIPTTTAVVTRTADGLQFRPGEFPASFFTRGMRLQWRPQASATILARSANGWSATMASFDGDGPFGGGIGSAIIVSQKVEVYGAEPPFRMRAAVTWSNNTTGIVSANRRATGAFEFPGGQPLTFTFQQYRGVMKIEGAAAGNGEYPVAYDPVAFDTYGRPARCGFAVGNRMGATNGTSLPGGTYGRYVTSA